MAEPTKDGPRDPAAIGVTPAVDPMPPAPASERAEVDRQHAAMGLQGPAVDDEVRIDSGWNEGEARERLGLDPNRPQPGDQDRLDYDRLVSETSHALEALGHLAFHRLVGLYANRRTRGQVNAEAEALGLDPDGVHAVLATLPRPDRSE